MPVPVEAIQGYLIRAGLKFAVNDQGDNGQFMLSFSTRQYRNPAGDRSLMVIVTVSDHGRHLEIAAANAYSAGDAKDVGKLCEFLMAENYATKLLRFELDRSDGEVRVLADAAPIDGSVTYDAFMRMLMVFPLVLDSLHPDITKVMATAKLPPPTRTNKRLRELVRRAGGIAALEKLVQEQEKTSREAATIDPELAAKLGLDRVPEAPGPNPPEAQQTPAPPPAPSPAARLDDLVDEAADEVGNPDDDDGPCCCDAPVDE